MTGDTTVGGTGRFDIRNVEGVGAYLSTGGNAYKLTKKGVNQFSLVGVAVDAALTEVDVQRRYLSVSRPPARWATRPIP